MCIAWDFLRGDIFVGDNSFLGQDNGLRSFFLRSPTSSACTEGVYARVACTRGTSYGSICTGAASIEDIYTESFYTIDACIKDVYIKGASLGGIDTRDTYTESTCIRDACIEGVCIGGICIAGPYARGFWVKNACICADAAGIGAWDAPSMGTYIESTCVNSVSIVQHSGMHSQSFWYLKMRDAGLEIQIRAGFACIKSACYRQNMEVEDNGLEIWVRIY